MVQGADLGDLKTHIAVYIILCVLQVFVANHTSMIDFIILEQMTAFAVIMQKHPGWVGKLLFLKLEFILYPNKILQ